MLNIAPIDENSHSDARNTPQARLLFSAVHQNEVRRIQALLDDRLRRAKQLSPGQMIAETIEFTPAMAEYVLNKHNTRNRPISQGRVQAIARQIRAGEMIVTSQGISFATDDALNNGQHRLLACVQTGVPIKVFVVFGETPKAFTVLDTQKSRNGSDTLGVLGYKFTTVLAASARQLAIVTSDNPLSNATIDNKRVIEIVKEHPNLQAACIPGARIGKKLGCSHAATTVAFYLIKERSQHADRLDDFVEILNNPAGASRAKVILVLRDGLMKKQLDSQFRSGGNRAAAQAAAVINAWNIWVTKSRATNDIIWRDALNFPKPV